MLLQVNMIKALGCWQNSRICRCCTWEVCRGWLTSMAMGAMSILLTQAQECSLKGLQRPLITMRYKKFQECNKMSLQIIHSKLLVF